MEKRKTRTFYRKKKCSVEDLYQKSLSFVGDTNDWQTVKCFYKNKSFDYWNDIHLSGSCDIPPKYKDFNGHQSNPINGKLSGVFFSTKLFNERYPLNCPFGDYRFSVPMKSLYKDTFNLYFSDFYYNDTKKFVHYILLVVTKRDTESDKFCKRHLVKLDPYDNPIFQKVKTSDNTSSFRVINKIDLWVEVFYTENVYLNVNWVEFVDLPTDKESNPDGVPNDRYCPICN